MVVCMRKKKYLIVFIIIVLLVLLFPIRAVYKDGGTKTYTALLYKIIVWNTIDFNEESGCKTGTEIHLFPNNFHSLDYYNNTSN